MKPELKKILIDIESKYIDFDNPNFGFVEKEYASNIYSSLLDSLRKGFLVREITDLNEDVSFIHVLKSLFYDKEYVLQLSLVGKYGILLNVKNNKQSELLESHDLTNNPQEKELIQLFKRHDICLLNKNILEFPIKIKLFNSEQTHIYQILFSDTDFFPWEKGI